MRRIVTAGILLLAAAAFYLGSAIAKPEAAAPAAAVITGSNAADLDWQPSPDVFPPGSTSALIEGNPEQSGPFVLRFRCPAGYVVPPHWHSVPERLTVLKGTVYVGPGTTVDTTGLTAYGPGAHISIPGGATHFFKAGDGEAEIQVDGEGPFDIHYVNADGTERASWK